MSVPPSSPRTSTRSWQMSAITPNQQSTSSAPNSQPSQQQTHCSSLHRSPTSAKNFQSIVKGVIWKYSKSLTSVHRDSRASTNQHHLVILVTTQKWKHSGNTESEITKQAPPCNKRGCSNAAVSKSGIFILYQKNNKFHNKLSIMSISTHVYI